MFSRPIRLLYLAMLLSLTFVGCEQGLTEAEIEARIEAKLEAMGVSTTAPAPSAPSVETEAEPEIVGREREAKPENPLPSLSPSAEMLVHDSYIRSTMLSVPKRVVPHIPDRSDWQGRSRASPCPHPVQLLRRRFG